MLTTLTYYCETCQTDVTAYGVCVGEVDGRGEFEITNGATWEDETHIMESHDLSGPKEA